MQETQNPYNEDTVSYTVWEQGFQAGKRKELESRNPFDVVSLYYRIWINGWSVGYKNQDSSE